jgi:hypothetical protein
MPRSGSISSPASGAIERARECVGGGRNGAEERREEALDLRDQLRLDLERAEPRNQRRRLDEGVVPDRRHRRVPAAAVHAQQKRRAHLLARRAQIEHLAAELDPVAGPLVEREVGADGGRVLLDEPLQAESVADLLVGGRDEDEVAGAPPAFACERRERDGRRGDLPLHVERSAPPDLLADELAAERVALPLARVGEHDVGVREQRERRPAAGPADARDEIRALGNARVELALHARGLQVVAQELCRRSLVAWRIRRIETDEPLQEVDDLRHFLLPSTSR